MITVTKPYLPNQERYIDYVKGIWDREYLTNNGPLVQELENKLMSYLGLGDLLFMGNGTIALQIAIKALDLRGKIITTPFSYVATTSSIVWENCIPVFADVDEETFNIAPESIEQLMSNDVSGIIATHCFGNACDIDAIQKIADQWGIPVIYDAAHAFGSTYRGRSIFGFGDLSTVSFHATKLFHTTEGGAIVCNKKELQEPLRKMRNFGHDGPHKFTGVGINGKNSELHAAMGLCVLEDIEAIMSQRKKQYEYYQSAVQGQLQTLRVTEGCGFNYAYFPVLMGRHVDMDDLMQEMAKENISPRRYFYPGLNTLEYVDNQGNTPISDDISSRVLCLPLYHTLEIEEQSRVINVLERFF